MLYNYEGLEAGAAGNLDEARQQFELALRYEPHFPPTLLNLQIYLDAQSDRIPKKQAIFLYRALNQFSVKDSTEEVKLATRAIALKPEYAASYIVRAMTHEKLGLVESAKADYDRAVALAPNFPLALYFRGTFFSHRQRYALAVADFTRIDNTIGLAINALL